MYKVTNPRCEGCGHRRPLSCVDTGQPRECTVEECIHYTTKECHIKDELWKDLI
ncbi:MAG: hypothetical protein Q4A46_07475 [Clostridia bacterium]|nr:hypothetical protein [Clostridia bacterium]